MLGLLEPGSTVPHSQHMILYCDTILQCDTNTEFCNPCGYLFNKIQNSSAGSKLCSVLLFFHLPTLKHKQVSQGWSEHAYALNKHQFSLFFLNSICINPSWENQKNSFECFFPTIRIVSELFSMCWGLFWFSFVLSYLLRVYIFCCTFKLASCSLAFKSPLVLLENNIIATKGVVNNHLRNQILQCVCTHLQTHNHLHTCSSSFK